MKYRNSNFMSEDKLNEDIAAMKKLIARLKSKKRFRWPDFAIDIVNHELRENMGGLPIYKESFSFCSDTGLKLSLLYDEDLGISYELYNNYGELMDSGDLFVK